MYNSHDLAISIKNEAKKQGIIIKDMLSELSIGSNTMSALYHGKSIAYDSLARIADYLECSVDYLIGRTNVRNEDMKNPLPHLEKQTVYNFEGPEGADTATIDLSKFDSLNVLHKTASSLSIEQINLLTAMAENMKNKD